MEPGALERPCRRGCAHVDCAHSRALCPPTQSARGEDLPGGGDSPGGNLARRCPAPFPRTTAPARRGGAPFLGQEPGDLTGRGCAVRRAGAPPAVPKGGPLITLLGLVVRTLP